MMTPAIAMAALLAAIFEVHSVPLDLAPDGQPSAALAYFAHADGDKVMDLIVLQGSNVLVATQPGEVRETTLPQGIAIFDIVDIDGDGMSEIVALQGRNIIRIPLALQGESAEPETLFEAETLWATMQSGPQPQVIAVRRNDELVLALATGSGMEYRRANGEVAGVDPYSNTDRSTSAIARKSPSLRQSLQIDYVATSYSYIASVSGGPRSGFHHYDRSYVSARELRDAVGEPPINWPWFAVRTDKTKSTRAYCAVEESLNTLVRACDVVVDSDGLPDSVISPGPARRYPGSVVFSNYAPPDFNGDGYRDLLLWNAPRPGISVDSLMRAVTGRNWPITLTVHLFSPDKGRFEPAAATSLTQRIPVTWFLTGNTPLRSLALADFNGDKKTDLAMCTQENEFSVWLYSDGLAANPDEKHTFDENITGIELAEDVAGNGKHSLILRSDKHVYALYAK